MKVEFFLAGRMRLSPASGSKRSAGVVIAVTGIALAMAVMLVSVAVMLGFKHQIREKVMGFDSQLTIVAQTARAAGAADESADAPIVRFTPQLKAIIESALPPDARMSLTARRPGILKTDSAFTGVLLKGLSSDAGAPFIESCITRGSMPDFSADSTLYNIVVSETVAKQLNLKVGSRIYGYFFNGAQPRARRLTVKGIYDTHFGDYDGLYVFGSIEMLRRMCGLGSDTGSAIEITGLKSDEEIDECGRILSSALMQGYYDGTTDRTLYTVANVHDTGALYFNWLSLLDTNVVVILLLMGLVAGLTLVSSLFIIILERVSMIGILKALGAGNRLIERTFIIVAERLVVRGLAIGNAVGLGLIIVQRQWHLLPLNPEAYYLDYVPAEINWWWVLGLNLAVVAVAALVLILPSRIIATLSPASSMRYE